MIFDLAFGIFEETNTFGTIKARAPIDSCAPIEFFPPFGGRNAATGVLIPMFN